MSYITELDKQHSETDSEYEGVDWEVRLPYHLTLSFWETTILFRLIHMIPKHNEY